MNRRKIQKESSKLKVLAIYEPSLSLSPSLKFVMKSTLMILLRKLLQTGTHKYL